MSNAKSKSPDRVFRRGSDGKVVVQKDGNILVDYDNPRTLAGTHLKGLEIIKDQLKKDLLDYKNQKV